MIVKNFTVPVVTGPTEEKLERAIKAIKDAEKVEANFYAEAAARGEHPTTMDGLTYDYYCTILTRAYLSWKLNGRFINYRVSDKAERIDKRGDKYYIQIRHYNRRKRTIVASSEVSYTLQPGSNYMFHIVYNPKEMNGHVYKLNLCTTPEE